MKQVMILTQMYAKEYAWRGYLPFDPGVPPEGEAYTYNYPLKHFAREYVENPLIFNCPDDGNSTIEIPPHVANWSMTNTAVNANNSIQSSYKFCLQEVPYPKIKNVFQLAENANQAAIWWDLKGKNSLFNSNTMNHEGGGHIAYLDGHGKWMDSQDWYNSEYPYNRMIYSTD